METPARAPGASFAPEDGDLLTLYLGPKIAGEPLPSATAPYIHDRDVYAAEPAALVSGLLHASVARNAREISDEWYFYTSVRVKSGRDARRCRAVAGGGGTWHSEKARQEIIDQEEGRVIGYRHSFTYEPKNGWLMTEYTLVGQEAVRGQDMPVLCKIYRSPHAAAAGQSSSNSISASKKRKAAVERSAAGSSGRVRRRLQFPCPPAPTPCPVAAPAASEFLHPIEALADKKAEDEFLLPIEAQAEKKAEDEFLVTIESQAEQETEELQEMLARAEKKAEEEFQGEFFAPIELQAENKAEEEFLVPIESQAEQETEQLQEMLARAGKGAEEEFQGEFFVPIQSQSEQKTEELRGFETQQELPAWTEKKADQSQGEFLAPIYYQAEQEAEQLRGSETQEEPLPPMASSRPSLISKLPMAVRYAFAGALASIGQPFQDWATEDEINSHYGDASPLMGGFSSPYDSTCELNCSCVCGFPPSPLTSYSNGQLCTSTGNFLSANQASPGCY